MKDIYIIMSYTGTLLSRIIKIFTKAEFAHVSLSLDKNLKRMYSFGRINPYIPFWGGFVHESMKYGTFKRFKKTKVRIIALEITDEQYNELEKEIIYFKKEKENYKFNVIGLFAAGFNKKVSAENTFYCAEFVKYILNKTKIDNSLPEIIKPEDFKNIKNKKVMYNGLLREYGIV